MDIRAELGWLKHDLYCFRSESDSLMGSLKNIVNRSDNSSEKPKRSKRVAAIVAASGGILCVAGIGLSFVTIGGSVGLIVTGGILCGLGGVTNRVKKKDNIFISQVHHGQQTDVSEAVEKYNNRLSRIKDKALLIGRKLEDYGNIDLLFSHWCEFWADVFLPGQYHAKETDWFTTTQKIQNKDVNNKKNGRRFNKKENIGRTFLVDVNGIDIESLLVSMEDAQKNKMQRISQSINDMVKLLEDSCPSRGDIDSMIEETLARL